MIKELGEGKHPNKPGFIKTRIKCLEQVRTGSPNLPLALESEWSRYSKAYAQECSRVYKDSTGTMFLNKINLVVAELGVHYQEQVRVQATLSHCVQQQLKIHQKKWDYKRAFEDFVIGLQCWVPKSMMNCPT